MDRRARRYLLGLTLATVGAFGLPLHALAHALPLASSPAQGSTVQQAPREVEITFGEKPDPALSSIAVTNSDGTSVTSGPTEQVAGKSTALSVPLRSIPSGVYTVTWKTVSAIDGHLATGSFAFGVGVSATAANARASAAVQSPPPSLLALAGRFLLYVGLVLFVGFSVTTGLVLLHIPGFAMRVVTGAWILTVLATLAIIESEREAAGISLTQLAASSLASNAALRLASAALSGVVAGALARARDATGRVVIFGLGIAGLFGMAADVASSHAGAQSPIVLNLVVQWLHIALSGVWIGGLAVLAFALWREPAVDRLEAGRRFSTIALLSIIGIGITGVIRALIEIPTWFDLFHTAFGVLVVAKVILFVVLAGLGAVNRFINLRGAESQSGLRRIASTEVVVGCVVLALAAGLVNVAPPVVTAATSGVRVEPVTVSGSDFATTVRLTLAVTPGSSGFNTFSAVVTDYNTGAKVPASAVVLHFRQPLRPQLGTSALTLTRTDDGSFSGKGVNLSLEGVWEVQATVENGVASTQVDLQLTTNNPAPAMRATQFAGGQTIYTVSLGAGRSLQVYLDPNSQGFNEFHMTYLTPSGNELHVAQVSVGMTPPGGKPTVLVNRPLDSVGHFVADIPDLAAGSIRFDVIATTPSGEVLPTFLVISPLRT